MVLNVLGATTSRRLLPRLKLSKGVVLCPKIWMQCGSRYASFVSDKACLMAGSMALITGLYVTTKGVPMSLDCLHTSAFWRLSRIDFREGMDSNAFSTDSLEYPLAINLD